jgi:hypothetical protein
MEVLAAQSARCLQAHKQVVECRRILKWTYAYGFYRFDPLALEPCAAADGEGSSDGVRGGGSDATGQAQKDMLSRKQFFEFLQGDAETALERLSEKLEKDLPMYYSKDEFVRAKNPAKIGSAQVRWLHAPHAWLHAALPGLWGDAGGDTGVKGRRAYAQGATGAGRCMRDAVHRTLGATCELQSLCAQCMLESRSLTVCSACRTRMWVSSSVNSRRPSTTS